MNISATSRFSRHGIRAIRSAGSVLFGGVLILGFLPGNAAAQELAASGSRNFCSATANSLQTACRSAAREDFFVSAANCSNISDAGDRAECQADRAGSLREDNAECVEQREARGDVCDALGEARYDPEIDPANFVDPAAIGTSVTPNPYLILTPGYTRIYRGEDEEITVTVTHRTLRIAGVKCTVVRDIARVGGRVEEDTEDYFAQDLQGNVWYFGEVSTSFDREELPSFDGSFKAGIDEAKPGIVMFAAPEVGVTYREEWSLANAEDIARVVSLAASASVPGGRCNGTCLETRNSTPIEPDNVERKFYAPGIGELLAFPIDEPGAREELVEFHY
ncbi:MAG: hypothetical protein ACT4QA_21760 [Panacagrimonas sp.]